MLTNISTAGIVLIFIGGAFALATGGFYVAELVSPSLREGSFNQVTGEIKGAFTLLFGLILALTIAGLSSNKAAATTTLSNESTALAQLSRTAQAFAPEGRAKLKTAVGQYVHAVAEDEFATMAHGAESPVTSAALANLYGTYLSYTPAAGTEASAYSSSLSKLDQITAARRDRLQKSAQTLAPLLRIVLMIGTIVFIVLAYPTNIKNKKLRLTVVGLVAGFVAFVFALTILLDYPFVGDSALSNQPYKDGTLAQYWPAI